MFEIFVVNSLKFGNEVMLNYFFWKRGIKIWCMTNLKLLKTMVKLNFVVKLNSNQYNTIYDLRLV
jgi:hypothetical protein